MNSTSRIILLHRSWTFSKYLLVVFLCVQVCTSWSQSRSGDSFSNRSISGANSIQQSDTIERPPLLYKAYPLNDISAPFSNIDTSIGTVHMIEPYYQDLFLIPNLGSENSARASSYLGVSDNAIRLDNSIYDRLFRQTEEASLVRVNRAFWQIHYGNGQRLGSSNLEARFYRSFARNIDINFNYHSLSDNGMGSESQGNSFGRIDLKLAQSSKHGNRFTYIHYDRPEISENISTLTNNSEGVIALNRSHQNFTIGNQIILKDSLNGAVKGVWKTKFKYFKNTYSSTASSIDSLNKMLLPSNFQESTLNYKNELGGLQFGNEFTVPKFGGDVTVSVDINSYKNIQGDSMETAFFENLFGLEFKRRFPSNLMATASANFGLWDASGFFNLKGVVETTIDHKLAIKSIFEIGKNVQSLEKRQLFINNVIYQDENWNNLSYNALSLGLEYKPTKTKIDLGYRGTSNAVLINRFGLYDQVLDPINQYWAKLEQGIKIGPFQTNHGLMLQTTSSDRIALPELSYTGKVFINLWLFKKRMYTQFGTDLYFTPSYDTPEFYALTGEFYNQDVTTSSFNIFVVNPYFNAKVGPFLFFIKAMNATYLLFPSGYETIGNARVAQYDQALVSNFNLFQYRFKFGFKWTLLD